MSRRPHITRSVSYSGPSESRALGGAVTIWCARDDCSSQWIDYHTVLSIPVTAQDPYQRFFASGTIGGVRCWDPANGTPTDAWVELVVEDEVFATLWVPNAESDPVAITGVVDLPVGPHNIWLNLYAIALGNMAGMDGATFQVIEGQTLDEPGCEERSGGSG